MTSDSISFIGCDSEKLPGNTLISGPCQEEVTESCKEAGKNKNTTFHDYCLKRKPKKGLTHTQKVQRPLSVLDFLTLEIKSFENCSSDL